MKNIMGILRGSIVLIVWGLNTALLGSLFVILNIVQRIIPGKKLKALFYYCAENMAFLWCGINTGIANLLVKTNIEINNTANLVRNHSYFVLSNHVSGTDILMLLKVFNAKIPFGRFFIKETLLKIPVLGWCWRLWCLPMSRHTQKQLEKNPDLKGQDIVKTKKFCERLQDFPITLTSFIEGTRFTKAKQQLQQSPYANLLKPRAGGLALALAALGDKFDSILDVTFFYHAKNISIWDFVCGKIKKITINIRKVAITPDLIGDYESDPVFRQHFQLWLNQFWQEKDALLEQLNKS